MSYRRDLHKLSSILAGSPLGELLADLLSRVESGTWISPRLNQPSPGAVDVPIGSGDVATRPRRYLIVYHRHESHPEMLMDMAIFNGTAFQCVRISGDRGRVPLARVVAWRYLPAYEEANDE
jgi:hypothetical protein